MPYAKPEVRATAWSASDYQTRLAELRSEFADLSQKDRESDDYRSAKKALFQEREDLDFEYRIVRQQSGELLPEERAARMGLQIPGGVEHRSFGELLITNEAFAEWMKNPRDRSPSVELRGNFAQQWRSGAEYRTLLDSTGGDPLLPVAQPFLPSQSVDRRRLFIRDVIAPGSTNFNAVPYVRELNAAANETAASTVAEGGTKPEATIEFVDDLAPVRDIAITLPVTNQLFEDGAAVMSYVNGRLSYMLELREELEILNGNGISPDLKGILTYSGVQTQSFTAGEIAITIGNAIAKVNEVNGEPNAVAMSPTNYWQMVTNRESGAIFDAGTPFASTAVTVWGLPIVKTRSLATNKALVGDFRLGAQIFDRSQARIESFEQHSDYAAKNKRLLRAEERLALAVYRPDWFVSTTLA